MKTRTGLMVPAGVLLPMPYNSQEPPPVKTLLAEDGAAYRAAEGVGLSTVVNATIKGKPLCRPKRVLGNTTTTQRLARSIGIGLAAFVIAGCQSTYTPATLPADHPANPAATWAVVPPAPGGFASHPFRLKADPQSEGMEQHQMDKATPTPPVALPDRAAAYLVQTLNAYFSIGTQLAADHVTGIPAYAQQAADRFTLLTKVGWPERPHFWHQQAGLADTFLGAAHQLMQTLDLHEARVAYGRLSEALIDLVNLTGIPDGIDGEIYRYTCGTFSEAPQGGIWLQVGATAQPPYVGPNSLPCASDKTPMTPAGDQTLPEQQKQPHKHGGH